VTAAALNRPPIGRARRTIRWSRVGLHAFLIVACLLWLFPLAWAIYAALRPYSDTAHRGYISLPGVINLDNFVNAWDTVNFSHFYLNTLLIVVPAVILTLFVASMVAFALSRFSFRFNLPLLMLFTAGNLLPPQVIIVPLYRLYLLLPLPHLFDAQLGNVNVPVLTDNGLMYDQYVGIILIHIAFQVGFCIFVLSNYMRTLPKELTEAAVVDGAPVWAIFRRVIMPLCRPALAALATLEFTFIYNDFFWALLLMKTGDKRPITSALNNLSGLFFTDYNLLAAGALLAAIPTILVFIALQKQFVRGLTLGSTKG
jgi:multiple sugar transport system permease protein